MDVFLKNHPLHESKPFGANTFRCKKCGKTKLLEGSKYRDLGGPRKVKVCKHCAEKGERND